ncbi:MAG: hypothetical protein NZ735_06100 [Candidatus Marinimicrobia bacterium]|nr:hypothetical protein [Candidatus Neomarinimicrobiota bacterium]
MSDFTKLFNIRKSLLKFEEDLGLSDLTELEKSMLEFVGNQPMNDVTLTDMVKNDYFRSYSFSTMKRSLVSLLDAGLLVQETNLEDGRKRTLKVAIDNI